MAARVRGDTRPVPPHALGAPPPGGPQPDRRAPTGAMGGRERPARQGTKMPRTGTLWVRVPVDGAGVVVQAAVRRPSSRPGPACVARAEIVRTMSRTAAITCLRGAACHTVLFRFKGQMLPTLNSTPV